MIKEKTMEKTMQRVIAAVITLMMILAIVPTYAFAETDLQAACKTKTNEEFYQWSAQHLNDEVCPFCNEGYDHPSFGYLDEDGAPIQEINDELQDWSTYPWGTFTTPCINVLCYTTFENAVDAMPSDCAFIQWLMEDETNESNSSIITIETEASTINVTVPTNAAFIFKSDGTNVYPTNYEITNNNGLTAITLDAIDLEGVNGWSLTDEDDTFQADVKKFALKMGQRGNGLSIVDAADGVSFTGGTEIKIAPNGSKFLDFEAKRGIFSQPVTTENAMQMTMHFDWEHAA